jgi:gluconolactonase
VKEYTSVKQLQNGKRIFFLTIIYVIVTIIAFVFLFTKCSNIQRLTQLPKKNNPIVNSNWVKVVSSLNFPEGPAWNKENNSLYFSNCYGGWISRVSNSKHDTFLVAMEKPFSFEKTNGMTIHNNFLYACDFVKGVVLKISKNGKTNIYTDNYNGKKFNRPNDLAFDKKGNLYFTDPKSYGTDKLDGRIFMVEAETKKVILIKDSLAFPNGIAFSADGKNLFVCESARNRILKFNVKPGGTIFNKTEFIVLPNGDPDGIAFDDKGNLYVAHFGTGYLFVLNPQGKIIQKIKTPGLKPTNVEFGDEDMKTLYLTEVETNSLYKIRLTIPGLVLN